MTPPAQLFSVPITVRPLGSAAVTRCADPAAGPVSSNFVSSAVIRRLYGSRAASAGRHCPVSPTRSISTTDRPWAAIATRICSTLNASIVVKPGNISSSLVYSWFTTSSALRPVRPIGSTPTKSLL